MSRPGYLADLFGLDARVAVVTGGTGVLGGAMARGLARAGARVAILGRRRELAETAAAEIVKDGGEAMALPADVLRKEELEVACDTLLHRWGRVDILVNAAGGNVPDANRMPERSFFEISEAALRQVIDLNLLGTLLPSQVFGAAMVGLAPGSEGREPWGSIVNISSVSGQRPLTRTVGYSAAKAAIENLTRWLANELARSYGEHIRVNAIAPGFYLAEQNRRMLVNEDGSLTPRGRLVIDHTPAGRFGEPANLLSTLIWLCGPGASFVNGVVVSVDGGFGSFAGV
jgi:NAD(P)-dependent dehydrogenase (short-subunit alcohol dehydrogenase family)